MTPEQTNETVARISQLIEKIDAGRERYVYYLLAVALAAIGFAASQTTEASLRPIHLVLGMAVGCWLASFYIGCRNRQKQLEQQDISLGIEAVSFQLRIGNDGVVSEQVSNKTSDYLNKLQGDRKKTAAEIERGVLHQTKALFLGVVLYTVWHVSLMYARSS